MKCFMLLNLVIMMILDDILQHFKQKYQISSKKVNTDEAYTEDMG